MKSASFSCLTLLRLDALCCTHILRLRCPHVIFMLCGGPCEVFLCDFVLFSCLIVVFDFMLYCLFQDFVMRVHAFSYTKYLMRFHGIWAATRFPYEMSCFWP
jgi:hypothetical protein